MAYWDWSFVGGVAPALGAIVPSCPARVAGLTQARVMRQRKLHLQKNRYTQTNAFVKDVHSYFQET